MGPARLRTFSRRLRQTTSIPRVVHQRLCSAVRARASPQPIVADMFSRTVLRNLALRRAVPRTIPRFTPRAFPPVRPPSRILQRCQSNSPWGRFPEPPRRPNKRIYTRYNEDDLRGAKPLVTAEQIRNLATHRFTYTLVAVAVGGGAVFYFTHIEEVPVSGRRRFNCYSEESVERDGEMYYKMVMQDAIRDGTIVPSWDPRARMVERVMRKLIPNSGLEKAAWEVHVLESRGTYPKPLLAP